MHIIEEILSEYKGLAEAGKVLTAVQKDKWREAFTPFAQFDDVKLADEEKRRKSRDSRFTFAEDKLLALGLIASAIQLTKRSRPIFYQQRL